MILVLLAYNARNQDASEYNNIIHHNTHLTSYEYLNTLHVNIT